MRFFAILLLSLMSVAMAQAAPVAEPVASADAEAWGDGKLDW